VSRAATLCLLCAGTLGCANPQIRERATAIASVSHSPVLNPTALERRHTLRTKVNMFAHQLEANPAFGALRVFETATSYRVKVTFKGKLPSIAELTTDPDLKAVVEIGETPRSRNELISLRDRIAAAAAARKIETMMFADGMTGKVEIHVRDVEAFRMMLAELGISEDAVRLDKTDDFPRPL